MVSGYSRAITTKRSQYSPSHVKMLTCQAAKIAERAGSSPNELAYRRMVKVAQEPCPKLLHLFRADACDEDLDVDEAVSLASS